MVKDNFLDLLAYVILPISTKLYFEINFILKIRRAL